MEREDVGEQTADEMNKTTQRGLDLFGAGMQAVGS